jgi:hypothetical protein
MDRPLRIAAVGPLGDALLAELRHLPTRPDVRVFRDLVTDGDGLARLQPDVLVLALAEPDVGESIGALRLLQQLWPSLGTVVVTDAAHELALAPVAAVGAAALASAASAFIFSSNDSTGTLAFSTVAVSSSSTCRVGASSLKTIGKRAAISAETFRALASRA